MYVSNYYYFRYKINKEMREITEEVKTEGKEIDDISSYFSKYKQAAKIEPKIEQNGKPTVDQPFLNIKDNPLISDTYNQEPEKKVRKPRRKKADKMIISGEVLTGALFLIFVDMLLPMLIALANNAISKDKIEGKDLGLTATQRNQLEPVADAVMKEIEMKANPVAILIITMAGLYGMNFMVAKYKLSDV